MRSLVYVPLHRVHCHLLALDTSRLLISVMLQPASQGQTEVLGLERSIYSSSMRLLTADRTGPEESVFWVSLGSDRDFDLASFRDMPQRRALKHVKNR